MFIHYVKVAFRNLWKYKIQNLIGIVGLSVGFVCFSLLMHISRYQLNYDTQYPGHERMYNLHTQIPKSVLISNFPEFEKIISRYLIGYGNPLTLRIDEDNEIPLQTSFRMYDPNMLDFFSFEIIAGDTATINRTPNSVVLFESKAKKFVDNPESLIGKTMNNKYDTFTITGIIKDMPSNSSFSNENLGFYFNGRESNRQDPFMTGNYYVLINKGVPIDDVKSKLKELNKEYIPVEELEPNPFRPASYVSSINPFVSRTPEVNRLIIFCFSIGLVILMIALFNYISFLLAQFYNRFKEGAIRIAAGAKFKDIFYLFYAEIVLGFFLAVAISFMILSFSSVAVNEYFFRNITTNYFLKTGSELVLPALRVQMLEYALLCLILGAFVCLIPARIIYNKGVRAAITVTSKGKKAVGRAVILLFQLIVLSAFITATTVINKQIRNMRTSYLPTLTMEEQKNIISIHNNMTELWGLETTLSQNIMSSQAIRDVTFSDKYFTHGNFGFSLIRDSEQKIGTNTVAPNFLQFFNAKLLYGNFFNDESDKDDVIVNQKFTEILGDEYLVGKTFLDGTTTYSGNEVQHGITKRIIGVIEGIPHIGDIGYGGGKLIDIGRDYPFYYDLFRGRLGYVLYVKAVPSRYAEARQHVEKCIREFVPATYELEFSTVYDDLGKSFKNEQLIRSITLIFSVLALILGLLSIFSSVMMNTEKRKKEIAIRKVNGAQVKDIVVLFSKTYMLLWTLACIIVFPVAYVYLNRWLESYSEHISLPVIQFFVVYILVAALIMITVIFRIIKVAHENPADVLKTE